jgi:hypothetical protein
MVRFGRQRDDEIEGGVVEVAQRVRTVLRHVDADLVHDDRDERVRLAGPDPGRPHVRALAGEVAQHRRGHHRAHGVHGAGKQHGTRQLAPLPLPPGARRRRPFRLTADRHLPRHAGYPFQ